MTLRNRHAHYGGKKQLRPTVCRPKLWITLTASESDATILLRLEQLPATCGARLVPLARQQSAFRHRPALLRPDQPPAWQCFLQVAPARNQSVLSSQGPFYASDPLQDHSERALTWRTRFPSG